MEVPGCRFSDTVREEKEVGLGGGWGQAELWYHLNRGPSHGHRVLWGWRPQGPVGLERTAREAELGRQAQSSLPAAIHHLMGAALEGDVTLAFFCRSKSRQLAAEGHTLGPVQGVGEEVFHFQRTIQMGYKCLKLPVRSTLRSLSVRCLSIHPASQPSASLVLEWDLLLFCVFFYRLLLLLKVAVKHHSVLKYHLHKPHRNVQACKVDSALFLASGKCPQVWILLCWMSRWWPCFKNIFIIFTYLFCVCGCMWRSEENLWVPGLVEGTLSCFVDAIPVIWLLHLPVMFSILYPLFYNVFINPLRIPTMHFDHILFPLSSSALPRPSLRSLSTQLHVLSFPLKHSLFCLCKSQFLEIYDL